LSDTDDEDKRVIADVNRLLASFKIDQKEEERILEAFEKFNTQGLILVDGHHVMLEVLNDIDTFNSQIEIELSFGLKFIAELKYTAHRDIQIL